MHRYECGNCQHVSGPFVLRNSAERYGQEHRDKRHDGMFPFNEAILVESGGRMPQASEWRIFVLFAVLILLGLASKAL
jgi:hypothetical protein